LRTLFDCQIKYNGIFEDCESFARPLVDIYNTSFERNNIREEIYDLVEMNYEFINQSKIDRFIEVGNIFSWIQRIKNSTNISQTEESKSTKVFGNKSHSFGSRLILEFSKYTFNFGLEASLGSQSDRHEVSLNQNKKYSLSKKPFKFLEFPYKSKCSYYDNSETTIKPVYNEHVGTAKSVR